jgi:hypothetical protein
VESTLRSLALMQSGITSIVLDLLDIPYRLDILYVYMFIRDLAGATRCHLRTFR